MPVELLGTSHISPISASLVQEKVRSEEFDIVAIELDKMRLRALLEGGERATFLQLWKLVGVWGALLAQIGRYVEHKLGARIGMVPGAEMKAAVLAAAKTQTRVALIDQPIEITLKRFNSAFTWRERLRLFRNLFKRTPIKKFSLSEVPDEKTIETLLKAFEQMAPALSKVLIHERNQYMVRQLNGLQMREPEARILAVVGAGHVPGMRKLMQNTLK